jgi:hypothetical protein
MPFRSALLLVTTIALALWHDRFCFVTAVCGERLADIDLLLRELAVLVATDVTLVTYVWFNDFPL